MIDLATTTSTTSPEISNSFYFWWAIIKYIVLSLLAGGVLIKFSFKIINKIKISNKNIDKSKQKQTTKGPGAKSIIAEGKARIEDESQVQPIDNGSFGIQQKAEKIVNKIENKTEETEVGTAEEALSKPEIINDYLYEKLEDFFRLHKTTSIRKDYQRAKENFTKGHYIEAATEFISIYSDALSLFKNSESYKNSKNELDYLERTLDKLMDVRDKKIVGEDAKNVFSEAESAMNKIFSTKTRL